MCRQDSFSCCPNDTSALLGLLVGIGGMIARWVHLRLCTIFLEKRVKQFVATTIFFPANMLLFEITTEVRSALNRLQVHAPTSTGTADVCTCAYCGIYAPCIGVLAGMNCHGRKDKYSHVWSMNMIDIYVYMQVSCLDSFLFHEKFSYRSSTAQREVTHLLCQGGHHRRRL